MGKGASPDWAKLSVLGFGCAAMGGRSSRKDSLTAIGAAWDAGITFYDTARSYGYGQSEGLVGEFLRSKRDLAVIRTKFGILPAAQGGWKQKLKPLARGALKVFQDYAVPCAVRWETSSSPDSFPSRHCDPASTPACAS